MNVAITKLPSKQRLRKDAMLVSFREMCAEADGLFVAEYTGINVADLAVLRQAVKDAGGEMRVIKNTVAKIALKEDKRFAPLVERLQGQLIYGAGASAPALAKAMRDFAKEHEELKFRGGAMGGEILEPIQIEKLADLPSREEMLGILAGTLNAPITKLARTLAEVPAAFARAVAAVRDAKVASQQ